MGIRSEFKTNDLNDFSFVLFLFRNSLPTSRRATDNK